MIKNYFSLVPERIKFDRFWSELKERNLWLIKMRFGAVVMLSCLILSIGVVELFMPEISFNTLPLWLTMSVILIYNVIFARIHPKIPDYWNEEVKFHGILFALIQICADFIALMIIIYFTGGVETPFYVFFVFHIIIGSLILPGAVMSLLLSLTIIVTFAAAMLEFHGLIPHYGVKGLLAEPLYNNDLYVAIFFTFFTITLFLSIYLANSIAKNLYEREYRLTVAYRDLENAERNKSQYVRSVVHDLKTPIAAATTYLNMLIDGSICIPAKEQIYPLERSRARLAGAIDLINDILHISQLKLSDEAPQLIDTPLVAVFEEIYEDLHIIFEQKHISYGIKLLDDCPASILSEPKLLKLALANLVSNACKYTESGGKVEVRILKDDPNVMISVADNGIGVPAEEQDKVFKDFYRSTVSKKKNIEGTGLGMSIVKQIIQRYGGDVKLYSPSYLQEPNRPGAQFLINIPIKK